MRKRVKKQERRGKQETGEKRDRKKGDRIARYWLLAVILAALCVLLNLLARIPSVCNFYADHVFGLWSETTSRLTGLAPCSVGEIAIYAAVGLAVAAVLALLLLIFLGRRRGFRHFAFGYLKFLLIFILIVANVLTLNLSFLYKTDSLMVVRNGETIEERSYTTEELGLLRNFIVEKANALSSDFERDEDGYVILGGGTGLTTRAEVNAAVAEALRAQKEDYSRLSGYYPEPKLVRSTYIFYNINTIGVYFPHTMEANVTPLLTAANYPYTAAHELSHLKGYIYENEANFIAYVACIESDNAYLQYSALINVLTYVNNDYYDSAGKDTYSGQVQITSQVRRDVSSYTEETIENMETKKEEAVIDAQVITDLSVELTEDYLEYYQSEANYSEVTGLLLRYYDGLLY